MRLSEAQEASLQTAIGCLQSEVATAVDTLVEIYSSPGRPHEGARITAAKAVLELAFCVRDEGLLKQKLKELEKAVERIKEVA